MNGKRLVAAESFTGQPQFAWKVDLFDLKAAGDRAFCNGVNLFVVHASAQQPYPWAKPGMTMGWWGTQFGPAQTWWTHGAPEWIQYVSRCQMILQKGLYVADICFLLLSKQKDPVFPLGYKADICNAKELTTRFDVKDNEWVLPDGMKYKLIVLPANCTIDISVARKIEQLIKKGGVVLGSGFKGAEGLKGLSTDQEVKQISERLFGTSSNAKRTRTVGKGRVYTGYQLNEVLQLEKITKDVTLPEGEKEILWIHRKDMGEHYYFISNHTTVSKDIRLEFRVHGLLPELWNPETGTMNNAPFWESGNGKVSVTLSFEAYGSIFVVFRKTTSIKSGWTGLTVQGKRVNPFEYLIVKEGKPVIRLKETGSYALLSGTDHIQNKAQTKASVLRQLNNDWDVSFQEKRGAPPIAHFDRLVSFTEHQDKGIRYFSGKATYHKTLTLTADELSKAKSIFLDLGTVKNVATITINGKKVRTFWKPPFAVEITSWCIIGDNSLEIEVTNLWPNRMIGDEWEPDDCVWGKDRYFTYVTPNPKIGKNLQVIPDWVKQNKERPSKNRVTFTTMKFFEKDDPLLPSGLLGPVKLSIEDIWAIS